MSAADAWFAARGWTPFPFQRDAWDAYLAGRDGLVHASTGTGKTYAAWFGPLLEWLGENPTWKPKPAPPLRVLWITPLRALAADTAAALDAAVAGLGLPWTVQTRTSDTSAAVRNRQRTTYPTALITTPESLCLMLTHPDARERLGDVRAVVCDEWHELLAGKRGVQVELALAHLRRWNPRLRTWGLSATLGNTDVALNVLVGVPSPPLARGGLPPALIRGLVPKATVIDTTLPPKVERFPWAGHLGLVLLPQVVAAVEEGKTALVFTNTRSQTEVWYQAILKAKPEWAGEMALHHGSLDRKVREFVEDGLRTGRLRCVVSTSSLDLGVDFSPVDRVVQVGSPKGVARLLQRAGRSGHQPGRPSRVTCVPTNALELVEIAAARDAAAAGQIEGRTPLKLPLDVLAQHLVTLACGEGFDPTDTLAEVRFTHAFAELTDDDWLWVLDFVVRGGDALRAYPDYHRVVLGEDGRFRAASPLVARRHRLAVGTIVGEAQVRVRFLRGGVLGNVEESFIGRLNPGDVFQFAGRLLKLVRVHDLTAFVTKATAPKGVVPRWGGGRMPLSTELAAAVRAKLTEAVRGEYAGPEMEAVRPILELQGRWSRLPAADEFLVEQVRTREGFHLFLYPFEGRFVHEGLAGLLAYRLGRLAPTSFTIAINDSGFELLSPTEPPWPADRINQLLTADDLAADILASLNAGELARRAFREIARVAGLVHPGMPGQGKTARQLQASSNLFFQVFSEYDPGNLLLEQARREVLERQLEASRLRAALDRLARSKLVVTSPRKPTPLAFPLLVDRLRQTLSTEKLADRVRRMQLELEREADG
jgi:ATP-dependent Lhr-like helicase